LARRFRDQRWDTAKQGGKKAATNCPIEPTEEPTPEATPKARARGNETTAVVTLPKISPQRLLNRIRLVIAITEVNER
jgi:hypothetical protein